MVSLIKLFHFQIFNDEIRPVGVSRLDFVRSGKYVLAKRGMMCRYSTQMTSGSYDRK